MVRPRDSHTAILLHPKPSITTPVSNIPDLVGGLELPDQATAIRIGLMLLCICIVLYAGVRIVRSTFGTPPKKTN